MTVKHKLQIYAEKYLQCNISPGINISYKTEGRWITCSKGFLDSRRVQTHSEIYYDIASLTKVILATYICSNRNWHHKSIGLDLNSNMGEMIGWKTFMKHLTVFDLLTHRSGLEMPGRPIEIIHEVLGGYPNVAQVKRFFANEGNYRPWNPRTDTKYSDLGYILLGLILESRGLVEASLETIIEDFLAEYHIDGICFKPATKNIPEDIIARTELIQPGQVQDEKARLLEGVAGHAGLFGTLTGLQGFVDLWLERRWDFGHFQQNDVYDMAYKPKGYGSFASKNLFSEEVLNIGLEDRAFGLVWRQGFYSQKPNHSGWCGPFVCLDPIDNRALVITANHTFPDRDPAKRALHNAFLIEISADLCS